MGFFSEALKQIFGTGNKNNLGTSYNNNTELNVNNIKASVNKKYQLLDTQGKIQGKLFTKLINKTNETISDANTKKTNTKLDV